MQIENCITIREAEPVLNPVSQIVEPARSEFIKISGRGNSWQCCFFNGDLNQCSIYDTRPVECVLLKCWDTTELTDIIFKETLTRTDILTNQSLLDLINNHNQQCSFRKFEVLAKNANYQELSQMARLDMTIRQEAVGSYNLSLVEELFCFGRPMFQSAAFYSVTVRETPKGLAVSAL